MNFKYDNEDSKQKTRRLRVLIAIGFILLVIPVVSVFVDPQYLLMIYITRVSIGSKIYEILARENAGPVLQVFVFNITNAEAFLSGEDRKLRVEEVGPFTYQEYRKNEDLQIDEEAGVMRYRPVKWTKFLPEQSIDDPELVNITAPNAAMLAMITKVNSYPFWANAGFNSLINSMGSTPIINTNVYNYLWGYEEPSINMFHTMMPGWITFNKMGILDRLYDNSSTPLFEVSIAAADKFEVKKVDGNPGLIVWDYENPSKRTRCNTFVDAYEGFAFTPRLSRDDPLRLYGSFFCRMFNLNYIGSKRTDLTPEAYIYEISNKSYTNDPSTECLCGLKNECIDGVSEISPCLFDLSIAISNAHFLYANRKIYERIEGIHPNKEEHGSEFIVEPNVGAVLGARFTFQANVIVKDVSYNPKLKPFSGMIVPLAYLKIVQPELPEEDKNNIRISNYILPYVFHGVEVALFIIGLILLVYAFYHMCQQCLYLRLQKKDEECTCNIQVGTPLMEENFKDFEIGKSHLEIYSLDS